MRTKRWQTAALASAICLIPGVAYANLVWPALLVEIRLLSLPIIAFGLLVEIAVLSLWFAMKLDAAVKAGVVANAISAALGLLLVPIAGVVWEVFPGLLLYHWFDIGTFNPGTWIATFLMAALITTGVEFVVLRWFFGLAGGRRSFLIWLAANGASVALAFLSLVSAPTRDVPLFDVWPFG